MKAFPHTKLKDVLTLSDSGTWGEISGKRKGHAALRSSNIVNNNLVFEDVAYVEIPDKDLERKKLAEGDIIVTKSSGSSHLVGKCAIFYPPNETEDFYFSNFMLRLRVNPENVNFKWVYYWLISDDGRRFLQQISDTTSGLRNLNIGLYLNQKVPLLPLPQQQQLAYLLDRADTLHRKRQAALALLDELGRSMFLEMFGDPVRNPKEWDTEKLGEKRKVEFVGGGTPSRSVPEYFEGNICWATSKDMKGKMLFDTEEHVTEKAIKESAAKLVQPGTILVVVKSKILLHTLPVMISKVPVCFGQDLKGIITKSKLNNHFLAYHLRLGQEVLLRKARGANTEGLTLDHLRNFVVMLPPMSLQERFATIVEKIYKAKQKATEHLQEAETLFQSLLHRAMRGEVEVNEATYQELIQGDGKKKAAIAQVLSRNFSHGIGSHILPKLTPSAKLFSKPVYEIIRKTTEFLANASNFTALDYESSIKLYESHQEQIFKESQFSFENLRVDADELELNYDELKEILFLKLEEGFIEQVFKVDYPREVNGKTELEAGIIFQIKKPQPAS